MIAKSCLLYHPETSDDAVKQLHIETRATYSQDKLALHYDLRGSLTNIQIPGLTRTAGETDELWRHTCFEAFIAVHEEPEYYEFNFSPSGHWAGYAFTEYRQRKPWHVSMPPAITCVRTEDRLSLLAVISINDLPKNPKHKCYRLGLSAVIETKAQQNSYWALFHPAGKPDFHHRTGFTLSLNPI